MKKLLIICAIALIFPVCGYAEPDEAPSQETSNWEIVFTVKYNSKDRVSADKFIADIMKRHEDACDVKIDVKMLPAFLGTGAAWVVSSDGFITADD